MYLLSSSGGCWSEEVPPLPQCHLSFFHSLYCSTVMKDKYAYKITMFNKTNYILRPHPAPLYALIKLLSGKPQWSTSLFLTNRNSRHSLTQVVPQYLIHIYIYTHMYVYA